ncbi:MAG: hypothetical protein PHX20_00500 [Candidatus Omnitrophica bacterium]|nr:hypothetical protein [Candidatus Omnitrophota bacterium]
MIKLDIGSLIFYYTLFSAITILVIWTLFAYKRPKGTAARDVDYTWKCSVCYHSYIDSKHDEISVCPLCGSYNKKGEVVK